MKCAACHSEMIKKEGEIDLSLLKDSEGPGVASSL